MKFYSPYNQMILDAEKLPEDVNVKLVTRHSIRFDNPPDGDYSKLLLTPEGIELARKMGESIERPLGICMASPVRRCVQTVECIVSGVKKELIPSDFTILEKQALCKLQGNPAPVSAGGCGWWEYYHGLQENNLDATKGITLEMEVKPMLDCIFEESGKPGTIDLICSHDSHLVILASALFGLKTKEHDWCPEWVNYAEGFFCWGTREDFTAVFRGQLKHFKNFYL